jgi:hypothetical protein
MTRFVKERKPEDVCPSVAKTQLDQGLVLVEPTGRSVDTSSAEFLFDDDSYAGVTTCFNQDREPFSGILLSG